MADQLTEKQKRFCDEYLKDLNATQAGIRAGYSEKGAHVTAHQLLKNTKVQSYIQSKNKKAEIKLEITRERVLLEYARIAFGDIRNLFDDNGNLINPKDMGDDIAAAVVSVEVSHEKTSTAKGSDDDTGETTNITEVTFTRKVKLADKTKALDALGRHLGLFKPDVQDNANDFLFVDTPNNRLALARKLSFIITQGLAALDSGQTIDHKPKDPVKPE